MTDYERRRREELVNFLTILEPDDTPAGRVSSDFSRAKWTEKKLAAGPVPDPSFANYRQTFGPPIHVTRAPWWMRFIASLQEVCGWYWLKRKLGKPDPWDRKAHPLD